MTLCYDGIQRVHEQDDLGGGLRLLAGNQSAVAGCLPQAEQGLERHHHIGLAHLGYDLLMGGHAYGVVDGSLRLAEVAAKHQVCARGELRRHISLEPSEDEGPDPLSEVSRSPAVSTADGLGVSLVEVAPSAEESRIDEVHLTPKLIQSVLHGGACQGDAEVGADAECGLRDLALRILDGLGLVEDHHVPLDLLEQLSITAEQGVCGDRQVGVLVQLALRAMVDVYREVGAEPVGLCSPIVQHAPGSDDQGLSLDHRQGLDGLSQAHIVGQHSANPGLTKEVQPGDSFGLVGPQVAGEPLGKRGMWDAVKAVYQGAQPIESRGWRVIEGLTQPSQIEERVACHSARIVPGGQEIGEAMAVLVKPLHWQGSPAAVGEAHQLFTHHPGVDDVVGDGAAHVDLQMVAVDLKLWIDGVHPPEVAVGIAHQVDGEVVQAIDEAHGSHATKPGLHADGHAQVHPEVVDESLFGPLIADGHNSAQKLDFSVGHPGQRRVSVDHCGTQDEGLCLTAGLQYHPRRAAIDLGQALGPDVDRNLVLEAGQDLGDELSDLVYRELHTSGQDLALLPAEVSTADRV